MTARPALARRLLAALVLLVAATPPTAAAAPDPTFELAFGGFTQGDVCTTICTSGISFGIGLTANGRSGQIQAPAGVAEGPGGELYVADARNSRVAVFAGDGTFLRAFGLGVNAEVGASDPDVCTDACQSGANTAAAGAIGAPQGIAVDATQVYVTSGNNSRVDVFTTGGAFVRAMGAGVNADPATSATQPDVCTTQCVGGATSAPTAPETAGASGVAVHGGEVFVAAATSRRVNVFDSTDGAFLRAYGRDVDTSADGTPDACTTACRRGQGPDTLDLHLNQPVGIAASAGELYVAEGSTGRVVVLDVDGDGTVLRSFGTLGNGPGQLGASQGGIAVLAGEVHVGDAGESRVTVFTTAGAFERSYGTGGSLAGQLAVPAGVAAFGGEVVVADNSNARVAIFAADGTFRRAYGRGVLVLPGTCTTATGCTQARQGEIGGIFRTPAGVAVAGDEVFVVEDGNRRVQVFDRDGTFLRAFGKGVDRTPGSATPDVCTTLCGRGTGGSGPGALAAPKGVAVAGGEVFVVDSGNQRVSVFSTAGTFLRNVGGPAAQDGGLSFPWGIAAAGGELYITDLGLAQVIVLTPAGALVRTIGSFGTGPGELRRPFDVDVDPAADRVVVADDLNGRVGVFTTDGTPVTTFADTALATPSRPIAIHLDRGRAYLGDALRDHVVVFAPDGSVERRLGEPGTGAGQLDGLNGLAGDGRGLFVVEERGNRASRYRLLRAELTGPAVGLTFAARRVDLGPGPVQAATVTNTGTASVTLDAIAMSGADADAFTRQTGAPADCAVGTVLAQDATCEVRIAHDPRTVGAETAQVTVGSVEAADVAIALSGSGLATPPDPEPSPGPPPAPQATPPATPAQPQATPTPGPSVAPSPLFCNGLALAVQPLLVGDRVQLRGLARPDLAGRTVRLLRGSVRVATTRIQPDGSFRVTVRRPARAQLATTRYRAEADGERSADYALLRRTAVRNVRATELTGRVSASKRLRPRRAELFQQRTCATRTRIRTVPLDAAGRFRVTIPRATAATGPLVFRLRVTLRNGRRTFSVPITVFPS